MDCHSLLIIFIVFQVLVLYTELTHLMNNLNLKYHHFDETYNYHRFDVILRYLLNDILMDYGDDEIYLKDYRYNRITDVNPFYFN